MNSFTKHLLAPFLLFIATLTVTPSMYGAEPKHTSESNKTLIQASFDRWRAGTGSPFELLSETADWTITGNSVVSKKYESRAAFMDGVIKPFNARVTQPLKPTMRHLYTDGDTVVALFDGEAPCPDGKPYHNTYAWFMKMQDGKIVSVTAFFDSIAFDEFWKRVQPKPGS